MINWETGYLIHVHTLAHSGAIASYLAESFASGRVGRNFLRCIAFAQAKLA